MFYVFLRATNFVMSHRIIFMTRCIYRVAFWVRKSPILEDLIVSACFVVSHAIRITYLLRLEIEKNEVDIKIFELEIVLFM